MIGHLFGDESSLLNASIDTTIREDHTELGMYVWWAGIDTIVEKKLSELCCLQYRYFSMWVSLCETVLLM